MIKGKLFILHYIIFQANRTRVYTLITWFNIKISLKTLHKVKDLVSCLAGSQTMQVIYQSFFILLLLQILNTLKSCAPTDGSPHSSSKGPTGINE